MSVSLGPFGQSVIRIALRFVMTSLSLCGTLYSIETDFDSLGAIVTGKSEVVMQLQSAVPPMTRSGASEWLVTVTC